jgi:hypothetical protein
MLLAITLTVQAQQDMLQNITDRKITVHSADASNAQWGEEIGKSLDDDMNTLYHSSWSSTVLPVTLNYHFKDVEAVDYFIYCPRPDGNPNGNFKEVEIRVSTASVPGFVKTGKYSFDGKGTPSKIHFPERIKSPKTIRFIVNDGANGFASCAEMAFYVEDEQSHVSSSDLPEVVADRKITVHSADASNAQWGEEADRSIDGNMSTMYHSSWRNTVLPVTLNYHFKNVDKIDYITYYPRPDGNPNGNFMEVEIRVSTASKPEFVKAGKYNFSGKNTPSKIRFPESIKSPKTIRFTVNDGANGFASCAEMEFYVKSAQSSVPSIFTDETCSKLRPNVTKRDIDAVGNGFYRNLARALMDKTYPGEFRIQQYKPYPNPDMVAAKNKTSSYSLLDNPTGICITGKDEELIVFAGKMDELVSLRLIDFEKGYAGTDFLLNEGINRFKPKNKGLLYVMYHTDNPGAKPVKIHIATGTVNGYYDITKHTAADARKLLNNARGEDFDILGKYAHVTFPVAMLKQHCPDMNRLIQVYDSISWLEQRFIGFYKYNRANANRMFFHVDYNMPAGWGAYAISYRTAYQQYPPLCNAEKLRSTDIWGPAHEVGHVNQTRPGFRWGGMVEVSNNVYSMYVQSSFGNRSRLMDEGDAGYKSRYEKGFTGIIAAKVLHSTYEDVFCKLIPFWQLELYRSKVKGQTDFYADVHEQIRLNPDPVNDGDTQLKFIKICCDVAKEDLTDFFKAWGMLTPTDYVGKYSGYGSGGLTLICTPEQIDELVRYAGKYPKPAMNVQYIHDDCVDAYKKGAKITEGTAKINGNRAQLKGWKNVAVFEVYDDDKLVLITPHTEIKMPAGIKNPVIYAVSVKGEKIPVTAKLGIWQLFWEENFDGNTFDASRWSKIPRGKPDWQRHMSNFDLCYQVSDGQLILRGLRNEYLPDDTLPYLTGGLWTKDKVNFSCGRLEIRAKLGKAKGAWPAFWMMPSDKSQWPYGGEIDIMERLNSDDYAHQTVHSQYTVVLDIKNPPQSATGKINPDDYNVYAVEMYADSLSFYINGTHTFTYPRIQTDKEGQFPFDREYYLLLDMQLGGKWVGEVEPANLPVEMWIDWVRFYKTDFF